MILIFAALAFLLASPALAKDYLVTPATYVATMAALASGDTVRVDPSVPKTAVFPALDMHKAVKVFDPPVTLILTGYTLGPWLPGDVSGLIVSGGRFDGGDAHNAILGMFRNTKLLGIATVNGTAAFAGGFENVYIENLDCRQSKSDCLDFSGAHGLEVNGMNCVGGSMGPGAHPDCVQMRALKEGNIDGVTFRNVYVSGQMQGVNDFGTLKPLRHVIIDKLRTFTSMYGQLQIGRCVACSVNDVKGNSLTGLMKVHLHPFNAADAKASGFDGPVTNVSIGANKVDPGPWEKSPERFP